MFSQQDHHSFIVSILDYSLCNSFNESNIITQNLDKFNIEHNKFFFNPKIYFLFYLNNFSKNIDFDLKDSDSFSIIDYAFYCYHTECPELFREMLTILIDFYQDKKKLLTYILKNIFYDEFLMNLFLKIVNFSKLDNDITVLLFYYDINLPYIDNLYHKTIKHFFMLNSIDLNIFLINFSLLKNSLFSLVYKYIYKKIPINHIIHESLLKNSLFLNVVNFNNFLDFYVYNIDSSLLTNDFLNFFLFNLSSSTESLRGENEAKLKLFLKKIKFFNYTITSDIPENLINIVNSR